MTASAARRSRLTLAAVVAGAATLRLRLAGMPLERDEGEYAYLGQLILQGDWPYLAAHNMKLPGVYYAYAAILGVFGETATAIRLGLIVVNAATIALVWALARRLIGGGGALVAAAVFAVLSLGTPVLGFTANAEHFVLLPAMAGLLLLAGTTPALGRIWTAGVLLGLGVVMKQQGAAFAACGAVWILLGGDRTPRVLRRLAAYGAGVLAPFALTCLAMVWAGAFEPFWFWTIVYAREYATMIDVQTGLGELRRQAAGIVGAAPLVWLLALAGAGSVARGATSRHAAWRIAALVVASAAAVAPGLRFSEHYFLLLLPAAAVLAGAGSAALAGWAAARRLPRALAAAVPIVAIGTPLVHDRATLFVRSPTATARAVYGANPFPEAIDVARALAARTRPDERIAVIGSEPEIYFYARRRAATSYIYMYPLMEPHPFALRMQEDMIAQLEAARPRYLVLVNVDTSWSRRAESSTKLLDWAAATVNAYYRPVGLLEIVPGQPTRAVWGDGAAAMPQSQSYVTVFERLPS
jgi:hypothetical protein